MVHSSCDLFSDSFLINFHKLDAEKKYLFLKDSGKCQVLNLGYIVG